MQKNNVYVHEFIITTDVYRGFLDLFKDSNPMHTDEKFAQEKGFKSIVMHGNILNGFISYFIGECLPEKNVMIYSQSIDFKSPVFLNDRLKLHASIAEIYESVKSMEIKFYFENSKGIKVAKGTILLGINV